MYLKNMKRKTRTKIATLYYINIGLDTFLVGFFGRYLPYRQTAKQSFSRLFIRIETILIG